MPSDGSGDTVSRPGVAGSLGETFAAERGRWVLWLPVLGGAGIGAYFALPIEPATWIGPLAVAILAVAAWLARRRDTVRLLLLALGAVAIGLAAAQMRTRWVADPVLAEPIGPVPVEGRVVSVEALARGERLTLDSLAIDRLAPDATPARVRLRASAAPAGLMPGARIKVLAMLSPPPAPAAPGAHDFQRQFYFEGLGAVGFAVGPVAVVAAADRNFGLGLAIEALRQRITERVLAARPGPSGAVAAAFMTGVRGPIPEDVLAAMRDSGLAHLLAISGLNIGLAAGFIFVAVRAGLALVPAVALSQPIKKWAAAPAIVGALGYTVIAGAPVPTLRAFLMIALVLAAVIVDRRGISMRLLAWAAIAILVVQPETLLEASFQLSFAAVAALIAAYEWFQARRGLADDRGPSWWRRGFVFVGGTALSTLVAGLATAPIALYHFNRFTAYGLAANLIAVPITSLWIMPLVVATFVLLPFGLEAVALVPMGWGIDVVIAVAREVQSWPGAVALFPAMPTWGLVVTAVGGLWLCLWRRPWRLAGVGAIAIGTLSAAWLTPPDVLVDSRGRLMAARTESGLLSVSSLRTSAWARDSWLRRFGQAESAGTWPRRGEAGDLPVACDAQGCIYKLKDRTVAFIREVGALAEDCWRADVVVSAVPVRSRCPSAKAVIDRFDLWRGGAHAIWLGDSASGEVRVESVNASRGDRPWVVRPGRRDRGRSAFAGPSRDG